MRSVLASCSQEPCGRPQGSPGGSLCRNAPWLRQAPDSACCTPFTSFQGATYAAYAAYAAHAAAFQRWVQPSVGKALPCFLFLQLWALSRCWLVRLTCTWGAAMPCKATSLLLPAAAAALQQCSTQQHGGTAGLQQTAALRLAHSAKPHDANQQPLEASMLLAIPSFTCWSTRGMLNH